MTDSVSAGSSMPSNLRRTDAEEVQAMVSGSVVAKSIPLIIADIRSYERRQVSKVQG